MAQVNLENLFRGLLGREKNEPTIGLGRTIQRATDALGGKIESGANGLLYGESDEKSGQREAPSEQLQRAELEFTTKFMADVRSGNVTATDVRGMEALYQKYMPEIYENKVDTQGREIDGTSKADLDGRFNRGELRGLGDLRHRIQHGILPEPESVPEAAARQEPAPVRETAARQPEQEPESQEPAVAIAYPAGPREEIVSGPLPPVVEENLEQDEGARTYAATEPAPLERTPLPAEPLSSSEVTETPVVPEERMAIEGSGISVETYDTQVADLQRALVAANPEYKDILGYTDKQGNRVIVDGFEGPRTREVIKDYAAKHDLGDPRELKIESVIEHAEKQALAADYDPSTHHYVEAIALKGQLKAQHDLAVEQRAELNQEVTQQVEQNLAASNSDLDEQMAFDVDEDAMKEQLAASLREQNGLDSPDEEMVADNRTAQPPTGPGIG